MAKIAKKRKQKPVEEIIEVEENLELEDLDIEGLDIEEIDVEEDEVDEVEQELEESAKKATKKERKGVGLASTAALGEDEVGAAYVAELCGVEARELRGFLRKNYRNMEEEKSTRYRWKKGDPQIQEIVDAFKAAKKISSGKEPNSNLEAARAAKAAKKKK